MHTEKSRLALCSFSTLVQKTHTHTHTHTKTKTKQKKAKPTNMFRCGIMRHGGTTSLRNEMGKH